MGVSLDYCLRELVHSARESGNVKEIDPLNMRKIRFHRAVSNCCLGTQRYSPDRDFLCGRECFECFEQALD